MGGIIFDNMTYNDSTMDNNPTKKNANIEERTKDCDYISGVQIIIDIIGNSSLLTFIVSIVLAIPLTLWWNTIDYCADQIISLCSDILTTYSCILGLVITGFSIILMLNKKNVEELSNPCKKPKCCCSFLLNTKSSPYDILCSSFSLCFILLLITIIVIILYKNQPIMNSAPFWQFVSIKVLCIVSTIYTIDLLFHLYEVSTFVNKNHREILKTRKK